MMEGLKILGLGSAIPSKRVHNDDLAKLVDTSDEWIFPRTGIHERRFCEKDESAGTLAVKAAKEAVEDAGAAGMEHATPLLPAQGVAGLMGRPCDLLFPGVVAL